MARYSRYTPKPYQSTFVNNYEQEYARMYEGLQNKQDSAEQALAAKWDAVLNKKVIDVTSKEKALKEMKQYTDALMDSTKGNYATNMGKVMATMNEISAHPFHNLNATQVEESELANKYKLEHGTNALVYNDPSTKSLYNPETNSWTSPDTLKFGAVSATDLDKMFNLYGNELQGTKKTIDNGSVIDKDTGHKIKTFTDVDRLTVEEISDWVRGARGSEAINTVMGRVPEIKKYLESRGIIKESDQKKWLQDYSFNLLRQKAYDKSQTRWENLGKVDNGSGGGGGGPPEIPEPPEVNKLGISHEVTIAPLEGTTYNKGYKMANDMLENNYRHYFDRSGKLIINSPTAVELVKEARRYLGKAATKMTDAKALEIWKNTVQKVTPQQPIWGIPDGGISGLKTNLTRENYSLDSKEGLNRTLEYSPDKKKYVSNKFDVNLFNPEGVSVDQDGDLIITGTLKNGDETINKNTAIKASIEDQDLSEPLRQRNRAALERRENAVGVISVKTDHGIVYRYIPLGKDAAYSVRSKVNPSTGRSAALTKEDIKYMSFSKSKKYASGTAYATEGAGHLVKVLYNTPVNDPNDPSRTDVITTEVRLDLDENNNWIYEQTPSNIDPGIDVTRELVRRNSGQRSVNVTKNKL